MSSAEPVEPAPQNQAAQKVESAAIATEADSSPPRGNAFPIVGIGASAGGLDALEQLMRALRVDTGMAFVIVQHLDPKHESLLTEILAAHTKMAVVTVRDHLPIEPNKVYVIPPNTSMVLEGNELRLAIREAGLHLPIDLFFQSLAHVQGSRAIGVVLSGNASDGSVGVRAIKAECGITFAQDETTARFGGMPRNAIATGSIDHVLSPAEIGRELGELGAHPYLIPSVPGKAESETLPEGDGEMKRIFALLQVATKVDFTRYKPTTTRRRIGRRMMVLRMDHVGDYVRHLEQSPAELRELYRDLLISVTSFFRDPAAFASLSELLGDLIAHEDRVQPVKVWVPGCSTGEEVYSIAICLCELLQERQQGLTSQLFGTDISEFAIERARQAVYSETVMQDVSPERLERFFTKVDSGYQINKTIRESCVFARHDVTRDPPFSRLDLVSCRNLLIYLHPTTQQRVLSTFHYALKPEGLLMLGSAETTGAAANLFKVVDKQQHIFRPAPGVSRVTFELALGAQEKHIASPDGSDSARPGGIDLHKKVDRLIQSKYSPDAVLVDSELHIVQFRGHTSPYLDATAGDATLNLLRMAREGLVVPLRRTIHTAETSNISAREHGIVIERDGVSEEISIEVTPVSGTSATDRYFLVVFAPTAGPFAILGGEAGATISDTGRAVRSERELGKTREYLRNLREEYEANVEELRAANEEARSANEELQIANEELGTTKEELQSANEELTTINEELQNRNQQLSASNSDLINLLAAVSVAIVMVDQDLRIRRFNKVAERWLDLGPLDIGRPVRHVRGRIETPDLHNQVHQVVETLQASEQELQDVEGRWYSMTIRPYRTMDNHIAGAVITIQDIDPMKRSLEAAEGARDYAEAMVETVRGPLVVLDADLRIRMATQAFYETFLLTREETEGRLLYDLGNGQWNRPRLRELLGLALYGNIPFQDYEIEDDFPHIGRRTMRLNARRIPRHDSHSRTLLAIEDVTERRELAEIRFQRLFESAKDGILVVELETGIVLDVNPYLLSLTGFAREDVVGKRFEQAAPFLGISGWSGLISALKEQEIVRHDELPLRNASGRETCVEVVANQYKLGSRPVLQFNLRDITVRKQAEEQLRQHALLEEQQEYLKRSVEQKSMLVREIHHRVKNNLQVIVSLLSLQSRYTDDPRLLATFEDTEGRVRAIANIHETLYASEDLTEVEFAAYLNQLVNELMALHVTEPGRVQLELHAEETVLELEQAIPLGLIANELVLNSLKHGLRAEGGKLEVTLSFFRDKDAHASEQAQNNGSVRLKVADSGPGLPQKPDLARAQSMGFRLLNLLSRQLRAQVEFHEGPGAVVTVTFATT